MVDPTLGFSVSYQKEVIFGVCDPDSGECFLFGSASILSAW